MPNIEELLRRAMADGKFDNLPGKGKPLHLDEANPHADPEWELAYRMLKESGYSLPWIEVIRDIEKDIEAARKDLQIAWRFTLDADTESPTASYIPGGWERSQQAFKDRLTSLNKRIRDYNLLVPNVRFQRHILHFEDEIKIITKLE